MPASSGRYYFKELRLQQFRSIVALSQWQTFSGAAAALGITRTSVWQQVRALEQELSCTLLRTRAQRIELTAAGQRLVEIAAPLVAGFDSAKTALQAAIGADVPQTLVIATAPSFILYQLRGPIARIRELHPHLHVSLLERNSPAAVELLEQGGADVAVAARPASVPGSRTLEYLPLATYPFTLICPPDYPLLEKPDLALKDLLKYPLILSSKSTYCRQHFDQVIDYAGLTAQANIVLESNFPVMLFEYVRLGMGIAITPLPLDPGPTPQWHQAGTVLRSVAHLFGDEPIYYVRRKGQFETPCAAVFRELVLAESLVREKPPAKPATLPPRHAA